MITSPTPTLKRLRLSYGLTSRALSTKLIALRLALETHFNPDQPRDELGRWTDSGGDDDAQVELVQGDRLEGFPVDLREEEERGGDTISGHVGKSKRIRELREQQDAANR